MHAAIIDWIRHGSPRALVAVRKTLTCPVVAGGFEPRARTAPCLANILAWFKLGVGDPENVAH